MGVHIMAEHPKTLPGSIPSGRRLLQRTCAKCGEKDEEKKSGILQRSAIRDGPEHVPPVVYEVLREPGRPLDAATRAFFEQRFGHDFTTVPSHAPAASPTPGNLKAGSPSDAAEREADAVGRYIMDNPPVSPATVRHDFSSVRVHSGPKAAESADALRARAFTFGQDIVFGAGQFAPVTKKGRSLIAHELTHVVQQTGEDPAGTNHRSTDGKSALRIREGGNGSVIRRETAGGGSTEFENRVTEFIHPTTGTGPISGAITRTETAPQSGSLQRQVVSEGRMNIAFDPANCATTIPFVYNFIQAQSSGNNIICNNPPPATTVPPLNGTDFEQLQDNVIRDVNRGLNGWFEVRLHGTGCPRSCADRNLPITVTASREGSRPDATIRVINRGGRADAGTICVRSWTRSTAVHEGGHQVLGLGDEYQETDERYRASAPQWFRQERVRHDLSAMGSESDSRYSMFHHRHFQAVPAFLEHAYPDCTATLQERRQPVVPDWRFPMSMGAGSVGGVPSLIIGLGVRAGIPLDHLRRLELVLGPQVELIMRRGDRSGIALLAGFRVGLEGSTGGQGRGLTGGMFGEFGYSRILTPRSSTPDAPYGELGLHFGYGGSSPFHPNIGIEAAVGATGLRESDPAVRSWYRLGLEWGLSF